MKQNTQKTVALFTGPEGHLSISQAAQEALASKFAVEVFYDRDSSFALYTPIYQYLPVMHQVPFKLSKLAPAKKFLIEILRQKYDQRIAQFIDDTKPDLCISTFYMYNPSLEKICQDKKIPFVNLVSDPATIHPLLLSKSANSNVVFDDDAKQLALEFCPEGKFDVQGWFVRSRFYTPIPKPQARQQLELDADLMTILITAGSEGSAMVMKLIPALFTLDRPVQVVVACGSNKQLLNSVRAFNALLQRSSAASKLVPLGFTDQIDVYMHGADLIVGKAGPNTLFESVATQTPFFAITHISGQEDGNLDLIRDYNLGFVEENPLKAIRVLQNIVSEPGVLEAMLPDIKALAKSNQRAATKLVQLAETLV